MNREERGKGTEGYKGEQDASLGLVGFVGAFFWKCWWSCSSWSGRRGGALGLVFVFELELGHGLLSGCSCPSLVRFKLVGGISF